jgi:hypothetical protein
VTWPFVIGCYLTVGLALGTYLDAGADDPTLPHDPPPTHVRLVAVVVFAVVWPGFLAATRLR